MPLRRKRPAHEFAVQGVPEEDTLIDRLSAHAEVDTQLHEVHSLAQPRRRPLLAWIRHIRSRVAETVIVFLKHFGV